MSVQSFQHPRGSCGGVYRTVAGCRCLTERGRNHEEPTVTSLKPVPTPTPVSVGRQSLESWGRERSKFEHTVRTFSDSELNETHKKLLAGRGSRWRVTAAEIRRRENQRLWKEESVTWRTGRPPKTAKLIHTSLSYGGRESSKYWVDGYRVWRESDHWQEVGLISGKAWKLNGRKNGGVETGYADLRRLAKTNVEWAQEILAEIESTHTNNEDVPHT